METVHKRDYRDILGASILLAIGIFVALYSWLNYDMGTFRHVGPGMFPTALGLILSGLGLIILVPALSREGAPMPAIEIRPLLAILGSGAVFALTINRFGLVVAIMLTTLIATMASRKLSVPKALILAASLTVAAVLIFKIGLSMQVDLFEWSL